MKKKWSLMNMKYKNLYTIVSDIKDKRGQRVLINLDVYNGNKYYAPAGVQPDVLNEVYRKALEWGENWRRPIQSIVEETIEETGEAEKQKIAEYIKTVRSDIEEYIYYRYQDFKLEIDYKSLYAWIQNKYPWIDNDNLKHAVSQGIYYVMK